MKCQGGYMKYIKDYDLEVYNAILEEEKRQEEGIELIASENFVSKAVMEAKIGRAHV